MTKNLTPAPIDPNSPLRQLDWTDDDYTMEIVSDRIYDRDLDVIFDNLALLNDRGGETIYFPSMAESGEHVIKIAIPPEMKLLLEQVAFKYHDIDISDAMRISTVLGMSIYEHKFGCELNALYDKNAEAQLSGDIESIEMHLNKSCITFQNIRLSCKIDNRVYQLLSRWSDRSGCTNQTMIGIWILYALRTHPRMKIWIPKINEILDMFERKMKFRIKVLNNNYK